MRPAPILLAVIVALALAAPAQAQARACPASFHVLHDDKIGKLSLPEGLYRLTTRSRGLSCARASALFTQFLRDYDGRLPKPWRLRAQAEGRGAFTGRGSFTVARTGGSNTRPKPGPPREGGGSHGDLRCPGTFEVLHDDRIGRLRLPAGDYLVTLLGGGLTCAEAEREFARFLDRPAGNLPDGWILLADSAEFVRGSTSYGFRVKFVG